MYMYMVKDGSVSYTRLTKYVRYMIVLVQRIDWIEEESFFSKDFVFLFLADFFSISYKGIR